MPCNSEKTELSPVFLLLALSDFVPFSPAPSFLSSCDIYRDNSFLASPYFHKARLRNNSC